MHHRQIKFLMDFACAFTALVLLSPVLGVIALTVKKKLGSPVVFRQIRPGLHGRLRRHRSRDFTDGRIESAFWEDGI